MPIRSLLLSKSIFSLSNHRILCGLSSGQFWLGPQRANSTSATPSQTTVAKGTAYEQSCLKSLSRLGFTLRRVGGRADGGIDLIGKWRLPSLKPESLGSSPVQEPYLRCIVQCKALARKASPALIRELEGAFASSPASWKEWDSAGPSEGVEAYGDNVVGVLCCPREATKGVREAVRRSGKGLVWVMVDEPAAGEAGPEGNIAKVRQVVWNERVAEMGAEGVGVGKVYAKGTSEEEVVLTWQGVPWTPDVDETM